MQIEYDDRGSPNPEQLGAALQALADNLSAQHQRFEKLLALLTIAIGASEGRNGWTLAQIFQAAIDAGPSDVLPQDLLEFLTNCLRVGRELPRPSPEGGPGLSIVEAINRKAA